MPNDTLNYRILPTSEQHRALELLGRCFPDYWEQLAAKSKRFPFDEMSFAAEEGNAVVGHVGVLFFSVSDGDGQSYDLAGIASVAVAPEQRGRGIANTLCRMAAKWAAAGQSFAALPLFTGLDRVYEKCGWRNYANFGPRRVVFSGYRAETAAWRTGRELTTGERAAIVEFHAAGEDFPGKVRRQTGTQFHGWPRIFNELEFRFFVDGDGYALAIGDAVAEAYFRPDLAAPEAAQWLSRLAGADGTLTVAMPESSRLWPALRNAGYTVEAASDDLMHGEHPMLFDLTNDGWRDLTAAGTLYFPLADKF